MMHHIIYGAMKIALGQFVKKSYIIIIYSERKWVFGQCTYTCNMNDDTHFMYCITTPQSIIMFNL